MYEKAFELEIITPSKVVFKESATSLSAPGVQGNFQILFGHAPFLSALGVGEIKVKDNTGNDAHFATGSGFVEVNSNHVVVLADSVERSTEIDIERAKASKARAEERLQTRDQEVDMARARSSLSRASNRLRINQKG